MLEFVEENFRELVDMSSLLMERWLQCDDIVITYIQNILSVDIKCNIFYTNIAY